MIRSQLFLRRNRQRKTHNLGQGRNFSTKARLEENAVGNDRQETKLGKLVQKVKLAND